MKYLFVYKNNTWWLKISTVEELGNYLEKTDGKWEQAFNSLIHAKEFDRGEQHASNLAFVIGNYGAARKMNPIEATICFRSKVFNMQFDLLRKGHVLFFNKHGGYHYDFDGDEGYSQFIWRKEFIFPDFSKNEIRIKRFPGGKHFYAYIGDMQVRDGNTLKWNTYEEAKRIAESVVTKADYI